MTHYSDIADTLKARMADLLVRARLIEEDLRHPLDADSSEQAIDLADDEALEGVDEVLRSEIRQIYGTCAKCGGEIRRERLIARPIATRCIACASEG